MSIGLKISELISEKKVAKKTIAEKLGIARNTLDDYIYGNTSITIEKLEKLSTVLNVDISYWFEKNRKKENVNINFENNENIKMVILSKDKEIEFLQEKLKDKERIKTKIVFI
jgi:transcriptional regulator with XRE-family HTH domain